MTQSLTNEKKGAALIALAAFCYGFLYYFGSQVMQENFSPYNTMFWRFLIAAITIFLLLLPRIHKIRASTKDITFLFCFGAFFHGTAASLYFVSANSIGSALAIVLLFTHPITVLLFNRIFFKNRINKIFYLAIILVLVGVALVSNIGSINFDFGGVMIGLLAAVFFGFYIIASKQSKIEPMLSAFIICVGCVVACFIFCLLDGSFRAPQNSFTWINILALGVICAALPISLFLSGLKHISSEKAAIISMLEPLFVMLIGYLVLGENVSLLQFFGALMIFLAAMVVIVARTPVKKSELVLERVI